MMNSRNPSGLQVKAKIIDTTKNKILYAGAALLIGLVAMAIFSSNAKAESTSMLEGSNQSASTQDKTQELEWTPHIQVQDEVKLPFMLKSQKLSH